MSAPTAEESAAPQSAPVEATIRAVKVEALRPCSAVQIQYVSIALTCRGSALISLELLSRDHPSTVNGVRPLLHTIASADGNAAVRRLAILCLKNGSPQRETIVLLEGLANDDEADAELRKTAAGVAQSLKRKQTQQAQQKR